ncbi:MAG: hypothetical protein EXS35_01905 [Pedosphaera sp.]|nr:hypothetical protein [Pedosphaera sp.]
MTFRLPTIFFFLVLLAQPCLAERINHEGRILGALPVVTNTTLFNTPNADAIVSALQIFPVTNPWNEDIARRPLLTNSDALITQINSDVPSASNRKLKLFQEMNYVLVPANQPLVTISFLGGYPDESDLNGGVFPNGLYPIATNLPMETWPTGTGSQTLTQWQQTDDGGDRHSITVQPGSGLIFETWRTLRNGVNWYATNGAIFNLTNNNLRPDTWTSGDAAGFPMFPALVRYDECQRGMVEHACRLIVVKSRNQHIYPATHHAGSVSASQTNYPAMGQRLRLKASYVIQTNWTKEEKALLLGLKKYGALVSDNSSSFFSISITPDDRWGTAFDHIGSVGIGITNFEVVQTTGPTEGPRSAGAATAYAGPDTIATVGVPFQLQGFASLTIPPTTNQWKLYSGPTNFTFANAALTNTTVTFNTNGVFTLMLSADDGVHAVAYDAVVIAAAPPPISLAIARAGTNANLNWTGGAAPFVIERTDTFPAAWSGIVTTALQSATIPITNASRFFRVRGS